MPNVLQSAAKVKSTLGASKEARRALQDNNETCWTIELHVHALTCTFGGGFSPVQVTLTAHVEKDGEAKAVSLLEIYPKDGNMPQVFPCVRFTNGRVQVETVKKALCAIGTTSDASANKLSVRFAGSTDGFGRVVVYHLGVMSQQ